MQTMNISLPDPMKRFVEEQVDEGHYSSVGEYIRELVRADQKRKAKEQLEETLLEALKSEPEAVTPEWWAKLRREIYSEANPPNPTGSYCYKSPFALLHGESTTRRAAKPIPALASHCRDRGRWLPRVRWTGLPGG
jgi:antitoxin ParD1/3/4